MRILRSVTNALIGYSLGIAVVSGQSLDSQIDSYLRRSMESMGIPGIAAAVVRDGAVVYQGAHGVRSLTTGEPLRTQHVFHFASISKPFVATAIVQLMEAGRLSLDDRVVDHLPYFSLADGRFRDITIEQMLNHTSGMPDVDDYEWDRPQLDAGAAERYVRSLANEELLWAPGSGWMYSNVAFDVLGDLIAKVSGSSFEDYMQAQIFGPLAMDNSSFAYPDIDEDLRTTGHIGNPAAVSDVYPYNRRHAPSSTLNSNVIDMSRWMLVNLRRGQIDGQRILSAESHDRLMTPSTEHSTDEPIVSPQLCRREEVRCGEIGLSWFLGEYAGRRTVFHGGTDTGFRSYLLLLPNDDIGIVLATNWQETDRNTLAYAMLDIVLAADASSE